MRFAAIFAVAIIATLPAAAADYAWPVVRVVDGDTIQVDAHADMPPELALVEVRLRDVDSPETWRPKCDRERQAGRAAAEFVRRKIAEAAVIVVRDPKWGKYGGRLIADLILDERELSDLLIEAGHGRPYKGGKRKGWCG